MLRLHLSTKQVEMCITNILFNFVNVNVKGLRHIASIEKNNNSKTCSSRFGLHQQKMPFQSIFCA